VAGWPDAGIDLLWGGAKDFRRALSGRQRDLAWSYLWLAPVDFQKSLQLSATGKKLGERLVLYYSGKR